MLAPELRGIGDTWPSGQFATLDANSCAVARSAHDELVRSLPVAEDDRVGWEDTQIRTAGAGHEIPVRIYLPRAPRSARPALVYYHGGAFAMGRPLSEHARTLRIAAEVGAIVVSVDYRLAPEDPFPAGFDDCYAALLWTREHADRLGADPGLIAVGGASAGGCLAAAVALAARDRNGPTLACQFLICPVLDDRLQTESMRRMTQVPVFNSADAERMWSFYLGPDHRSEGSEPTSSYAAPARALDLRGLPPAYVMTAQYDPLRDEAIEFAMRCLASGVTVELHNVAGAVHGFDVLADGPLARFALRAQLDALARLLGPG
jgi:acetyl esterase/lipase